MSTGGRLGNSRTIRRDSGATSQEPVADGLGNHRRPANHGNYLQKGNCDDAAAGEQRGPSIPEGDGAERAGQGWGRSGVRSIGPLSKTKDAEPKLSYEVPTLGDWRTYRPACYRDAIHKKNPAVARGIFSPGG